MNRWSIRSQLTFWFALALGIVLIAYSVFFHTMMSSYLLARIDAELVEESNELAEEVEITKTEHEFRRRFQQRYSDQAIFGFQICRMNGDIDFGSPWLNEIALPHPTELNDKDFRSLVDQTLFRTDRWRVLSRTLSLPSEPLVIHVLAPLKSYDSQRSMLTWLLTLSGAVSLLVALAIGYGIAQRVMIPILRITAAAERISSENLTERVPVLNRQDELGRLAVTLNGTFDRLQRSITEIRRFTADAAHELRTPLAVIRTEAEVALRQSPTEQQFAPQLFYRVAEVALSETTRLSSLVDQLLTLSRHDSGSHLPQFEEVSLRALLLDVADTFRVVIQKKGQTLVVGEIADDTILGDDTSLSQLFFNLIDNAMRYSPNGGTIRISSKTIAGMVLVTVEDFGIGIEQKHLNHIFERFYRVDASRNSSGTGLGLAICQAIAAAHHGSIRVESHFGRGSVFTVALPVMNAESPVGKAVSHPSP